MAKIAIDVALFPSDKMMDFAVETNRKLKNHQRITKIVLDKNSCIPHISLCMGVVDEKDISEVKAVLKAVSEEYESLTLTTSELSALTISTGEKVTGVLIENNSSLQTLHEEVMKKLHKFLTYDVDASMFYNPNEIEDITFTWIKGYEKKHANPDSFHPHMTVGLGIIDGEDIPKSFEAPTLALCRLGNYCTCRKVIAKFDLRIGG